VTNCAQLQRRTVFKNKHRPSAEQNVVE